MNIYVGNLSYGVRETEIQQVMEEYGTVSSVKVIMDRETGRSKGFGFVDMPNDLEAARAISELNETVFKGRNMIVKEAQPPKSGF